MRQHPRTPETSARPISSCSFLQATQHHLSAKEDICLRFGGASIAGAEREEQGRSRPSSNWWSISRPRRWSLGDSISGRNNCHATEKGDELTPFHGCSSAIIALSEILDHSRLPPDGVPEMAPHRPRKL